MLIIEQLTTETEHFKIQIHAQEETVVILFKKSFVVKLSNETLKLKLNPLCSQTDSGIKKKKKNVFFFFFLAKQFYLHCEFDYT